MADYTSDAGREPIDPRKLPFIRLIRRTYVKKRTDVGIDLPQCTLPAIWRTLRLPAPSKRPPMTCGPKRLRK